MQTNQWKNNNCTNPLIGRAYIHQTSPLRRAWALSKFANKQLKINLGLETSKKA